MERVVLEYNRLVVLGRVDDRVNAEDLEKAEASLPVASTASMIKTVVNLYMVPMIGLIEQSDDGWLWQQNGGRSATPSVR